MNENSRTAARPRRVVMIGALVGAVLVAGVLPPPPNPVHQIARQAVTRHVQP
ncbi:hypothetical protein AB0J52_06840 [Spirillospora sp. NPDC049652]